MNPDGQDTLAWVNALVKTAPDAILIIDENGIVEFANDKLLELFGYKPSELVGQNVSNLMPSPYSEGHDSYLERYLQTGARKVIGVTRNLEAKRKDGTIFPIELSVGEFYAGADRKFTGFIRDVSERKLWEQKFKDETARVAALVETAPDAIITIDEHGFIESVNPRVCELFGYASEKELIGCKVNMLMSSPHQIDHDNYLKRYLRTQERRIIGITRELEAKRKDGSIFWMRLYVGELRVGSDRKFTGFIQDISEQKAAEKEINSLNQKLKQRVQQRTQELNRAQQTLRQQERLASLGTLVAGVAHEIRNPLGFIINFAKLVDRDVKDLLEELDKETPDSEEIEELSGGIQDSSRGIVQHGDRIANIVNAMLTHSRPQSGQVWSQVDVNALLNEYLNIAYHSFRAQHPGFVVERTLELETNSPSIWGAAPRLGQVFLNILNNAFEAMHDQKLQESSFSPRLMIRTTFQDKELIIEISDNGPGIPQSAHNQIFDAFFTTKEPGKGTGLGLSLSNTIITSEYNGEIRAESVEGEGTTFIISLPEGRPRKETL